MDTNVGFFFSFFFALWISFNRVVWICLLAAAKGKAAWIPAQGCAPRIMYLHDHMEDVMGL